MKKLMFLIVLAVTGLTFNATAQEGSDADNKVRFGLKGGFNIANVYDQENGDYHTDGKVGIVVGAFLTIPLGQSFGFQPEMLFSQKGFSGTWQGAGATYEFARTTSYLDVPLLLALKAGTNVSILAGPHFSFLLAQRDQVSNGTYSVVHDQTFSNENPRQNTMGFTGGLDINLRPVILGARVGWDFVRNNGDGTSSTPTYKNVWLQATIGFIL